MHHATRKVVQKYFFQVISEKLFRKQYEVQKCMSADVKLTLWFIEGANLVK